MSDETPLEDRIAALEQRVAAIESEAMTRLPASDAGEAAEAILDQERFWALSGLKARIGSRSAVLFVGSVDLPGGRSYVWQQAFDIGRMRDLDLAPAAEALAALGHPLRLQLLRAVLTGVNNTAGLSEVEGVGTTGQLYHHLRQLVAAGWLTAAGRGRYEVPAGRVIPLLVTIAAAGQDPLTEKGESR